MFKNFFLILIISLIFLTSALAEKVIVFEFTEEEKKILKVRKIKKETTYTLGLNENGNFLRAEAEGKASGLGIEKKIKLIIKIKKKFLNINIV